MVRKLNTGEYGAPTVFDIFWNFVEGKLSPAFGILVDIAKGEGFVGEKLTPQYLAEQALLPITIQEAKDIYKDPNSANMIVAMLAEIMGIGTTDLRSRVRVGEKYC